jgi:hypothetical protein
VRHNKIWARGPSVDLHSSLNNKMFDTTALGGIREVRRRMFSQLWLDSCNSDIGGDYLVPREDCLCGMDTTCAVWRTIGAAFSPHSVFMCFVWI